MVRERYDGHNRKPGAAARKKAARNRWTRRFVRMMIRLRLRQEAA